MYRLLLLLAAISLCIPATSDARLTRLEITKTEPLAGGISWGNSGPYERVTGTAYFEVDSNHHRNEIIVDLDKAPRNARGKVEFSTQFMIVKPVDLGRSNRKIFYRINNRGNNSLYVAQTVD
jgi:hypothetical protein